MAGVCGARLRKTKPIWQRLLELDADADAAGIEMDFHILHREELHVFPLGAQEHIRQHENVEAESRGVSVSEHAILPLGSGFRPKIVVRLRGG